MKFSKVDFLRMKDSPFNCDVLGAVLIDGQLYSKDEVKSLYDDFLGVKKPLKKDKKGVK